MSAPVTEATTREQRFGNWLRRVRESKKMTVTEVARKGGIGRSTYEGFERANRRSRGTTGTGVASIENTPAGQFVALAEGLDLELGYVLHKAGFALDAGGTNMDRLMRVEGIIDVLDAREHGLRAALAEAIDRLDTVGDTETAKRLAVELAGLDLVTTRLREGR